MREAWPVLSTSGSQCSGSSERLLPFPSQVPSGYRTAECSRDLCRRPTVRKAPRCCREWFWVRCSWHTQERSSTASASGDDRWATMCAPPQCTAPHARALQRLGAAAPIACTCQSHTDGWRLPGRKVLCAQWLSCLPASREACLLGAASRCWLLLCWTCTQTRARAVVHGWLPAAKRTFSLLTRLMP